MLLRRLIGTLVMAAALAGYASVARAALFITVDKSAQQLTVAVDGVVLWTWPVSTGRAGYDTPNGHYTAFRMEEDHFSKEWDDAPMPHSIFFTRVGHAIHGTSLTKWLGRPASHGCVRLAPENAALLFAMVKQHGLANTRVTIDGELPPEPPAVATVAPGAPAGARRVPDVTGTVGLPLPRPNGRPNRDDVTRAPSPEHPRQRAARAYAEPPAVERRAQPPAEVPARPYRRLPSTAGVYYDPRVEIIEQRYVNGTWVRRRTYRQARPEDFFRQR